VSGRRRRAAAGAVVLGATGAWLVVAAGGPPDLPPSSGGAGAPAAVRAQAAEPASDRLRPALPPAGPVDYQLGAAYPPAAGVRVVERDRTAAPAPGAYGICYVNGYQTQAEEAGWWRVHHPGLLLHDRRGREVTDPDWPGEVLLDTRTASRRAALATALGGWVRGCAASGFRAVELDNLDSWTRSRGLLTRDAAIALARLLTARSHLLGLAVAQKNTAELAPLGRSIGFDLAIAEECEVYDECDAYTGVYGTHVIEVEYADQGRGVFDRACRRRAGRVSLVYRDRALVAPGGRGYRYATC
jgi:Glycoside-hydrolase family GH114